MKNRNLQSILIIYTVGTLLNIFMIWYNNYVFDFRQLIILWSVFFLSLLFAYSRQNRYLNLVVSFFLIEIFSLALGYQKFGWIFLLSAGVIGTLGSYYLGKAIKSGSKSNKRWSDMLTLKYHFMRGKYEESSYQKLFNVCRILDANNNWSKYL